MARRIRTNKHALVLLALLAVAVSAGCPRLAGWRDQQIATSKTLAQGDRIMPPAQPVAVPKSIAQELPYDASFIALEYSKQGKSEQVRYLSAWDGEQTAIWLIGELARLGYSSGENASRVLEGVTYFNDQAKYSELWVKVAINSCDQCTLTLSIGKQA